jgi:hypothetical protein
LSNILVLDVEVLAYSTSIARHNSVIITDDL